MTVIDDRDRWTGVVGPEAPLVDGTVRSGLLCSPGSRPSGARARGCTDRNPCTAWYPAAVAGPDVAAGNQSLTRGVAEGAGDHRRCGPGRRTHCADRSATARSARRSEPARARAREPPRADAGCTGEPDRLRLSGGRLSEPDAMACG